MHPRLALHRGRDKIASTVGRSVVHDQHAQPWLRQDPGQQIRDIFPLIIGGNDDQAIRGELAVAACLPDIPTRVVKRVSRSHSG